MKKLTTLLGVAVAMAGLSAQVAPNATQAAASQQVSEQSAGSNSTPEQKQQQQPATGVKSIVIKRYEWPDELVGLSNRKYGVKVYARNWSSHSSGFNRIKHSRNTRRKHRRA